MKTLTFTEKSINIRPNLSVTATELKIIGINNMCEKVVAHIFIGGYPKCIVLWEGIDYKPMSEWTEVEINNKIMEVL